MRPWGRRSRPMAASPSWCTVMVKHAAEKRPRGPLHQACVALVEWQVSGDGIDLLGRQGLKG